VTVGGSFYRFTKDGSLTGICEEQLFLREKLRWHLPRDNTLVKTAGGIWLRRTMMKTAFGILALYVSIPLAIVAAQSIVAHEAAQQQRSAHTAVAQVVPAAVVVASH
jgi:hypothetical protein